MGWLVVWFDPREHCLTPPLIIYSSETCVYGIGLRVPSYPDKLIEDKTLQALPRNGPYSCMNHPLAAQTKRRS